MGLGLIVTNTAGKDGNDAEEQASSSPLAIPSIIVDTAAVVENPAALNLGVYNPVTYRKSVDWEVITPYPEQPSYMGRSLDGYQ